MKKIFLMICFFLVYALSMFAQKEGDVIINEIGNSGTKKALYSGGEYVELLVLKEGGIKLAGWYLTDLTSPTSQVKETEGAIKFSDGPKSIFNNVIPKGTYILICLGDKDANYGPNGITEDLKTDDGNNSIVVFAYHSPDNIDTAGGKIVLTGKDNIALLSGWDKKKAVDAISWGGSSKWEGCAVTVLPEESLANGYIAYFKPANGNFADNTSPANWISTSNPEDATPGKVNKDVDDSSIQKNK
jgi:hypothetical protein